MTAQTNSEIKPGSPDNSKRATFACNELIRDSWKILQQLNDGNWSALKMTYGPKLNVITNVFSIANNNGPIPITQVESYFKLVKDIWGLPTVTQNKEFLQKIQISWRGYNDRLKKILNSQIPQIKNSFTVPSALIIACYENFKGCGIEGEEIEKLFPIDSSVAIYRYPKKNFPVS